MSRLFGPVAHFGYAVADIEAAMHHWTERLGIGPFLYAPRVEMPDFEYRGQPGCPVLAIATASSGPIEIELVQPLDDSPSAYLDFVRRNGSGQQHIGFHTTTMDEHLKLVAARGWTILMQSTSGGARSIHFDTAGDFAGTVVQLSETTPAKLRKGALQAELAATWDGTDPIRLRSSIPGASGGLK